MLTTKLITLLSILMSPLVEAPLHGHQAMSEDEVNRAIADARAHDVQPYSLRHPLNTTEVISGFVYTPYVRIAQFARRAMLRGDAVTANDIPAAVREPVIHVVMRAPHEDRRTAGQPMLVAAIARPQNALPPERSAFFDVRNLRPPIRLETRRAADAVLGVVPLDGVPIVGVFPLSSLEQELVEFCAYQDFISDGGAPGHNVVAGYIRGPLR